MSPALFGTVLSLHLFFAVVWVGGMFFAYVFLRPSLSELDAPARTALWAQVLGRFFSAILIAIPVLLCSGLYMVYGRGEDLGHTGQHIQVMFGFAVIMMLLFGHTWFAPYRRLRRAVAAGDTPLAAQQVAKIRVMVAINLLLGVAIVLIASGGRYIIG